MLLLSDEIRQHIGNKLRGGEKVERKGREAGRGEATFGDAVSARCLPAAIPPFFSAGRTGHFPKQLLSHSA